MQVRAELEWFRVAVRNATLITLEQQLLSVAIREPSEYR